MQSTPNCLWVFVLVLELLSYYILALKYSKIVFLNSLNVKLRSTDGTFIFYFPPSSSSFSSSSHHLSIPLQHKVIHSPNFVFTFRLIEVFCVFFSCCFFLTLMRNGGIPVLGLTFITHPSHKHTDTHMQLSTVNNSLTKLATLHKLPTLHIAILIIIIIKT